MTDSNNAPGCGLFRESNTSLKVRCGNTDVLSLTPTGIQLDGALTGTGIDSLLSDIGADSPTVDVSEIRANLDEIVGAVTYHVVGDSFTVATNTTRVVYGRLTLTGSNHATVVGTGRLRISGSTSDAPNDLATFTGRSFYAPGSFTVRTGEFRSMVKRLQLTGTQRATLVGTARLSIR